MAFRIASATAFAIAYYSALYYSSELWPYVFNASDAFYDAFLRAFSFISASAKLSSIAAASTSFPSMITPLPCLRIH